MGFGRLWGTAIALVLIVGPGVGSGPAGFSSTGVPGPATTETIRVDNGTGVTIWERTTDTNILTYSVATLTGPGGTFDSIASEHYTFSSDGAYLKIHCYRPTHGTGTSTGNNIAAVRLNGVPAHPGGLWATEIVSYEVGYGGIEESRFAALGANLSDITFMGDQDSELVLAFTVEQSANQAPEIASFTSTTAVEGGAVTFTTSASDPDGDSLTYAFDFESDGTWDISGPDPASSHVYGDDFSGSAKVRVSDGLLSTEASTAVRVTNAAPALSILPVPTGTEAAPLSFEVEATDPGSDDLSVAWSGECAGWSAPRTYPNDPSRFPDPDPSADIHPREISDAQTIVCGDDGEFAWSVRAEDDDGGATTLSGTFLVADRPPAFEFTYCPQIVGCSAERDEGAPTVFWILLHDPGSDDVATTWMWGDGTPSETASHFNDGVGPDPPHSPAGTFPFPIDETRSHAFGDDGDYGIQALARDDDGGEASAQAAVTIRNVAPGLAVSPPSLASVDEGTAVTLGATAVDPGSDDLTFEWRWDYGPDEVRTFFNDGAGPDPSSSPGGTYPFLAGDASTYVYGDDCVCLLVLVVSDDDGGSVTYTTTVQVANLPPTVRGNIRVSAIADLTLRVAGEKWHDVSLTVYAEGAAVGTASVVRVPGSPDEQAVTLHGVAIDPLLRRTSATVEYTPLDDPINGQENGADPAWLILTGEDGTEARVEHTFNVQHSETWTWTVPDLRALLAGFPIRFEGSAADLGSDDLTFRWSWGDGTPDFVTRHFNDGVGPDPYPSPMWNPISVTEVVTHAFSGAGPHTVTLTVVDDDGGEVSVTVTFSL